MTEPLDDIGIGILYRRKILEDKPQAEAHKRTMVHGYIEIVSTAVKWRHNLSKADLYFIGEFTRENISSWLEHQRNPNWIGLLPVEDFHAVCDNIDIPWATEEAKMCYSAKLPWWKD